MSAAVVPNLAKHDILEIYIPICSFTLNFAISLRIGELLFRSPLKMFESRWPNLSRKKTVASVPLNLRGRQSGRGGEGPLSHSAKSCNKAADTLHPSQSADSISCALKATRLHSTVLSRLWTSGFLLKYCNLCMSCEEYMWTQLCLSEVFFVCVSALAKELPEGEKHLGENVVGGGFTVLDNDNKKK